MLENLLQLVTENAGEHIINNPEIPNEQNQKAIDTTTSSIMDGLKSQLGGTNGANVLKLLGGQSSLNGNPVVNGLVGNVTNSLMDKLGVTNPVAKSIAVALVPVVLSKLISKTNDPKDSSIDINSLMGGLSNGKSEGLDFGSLLGGMSGNQQGNQSQPDIGTLLGGLFGK